MSPPPTLRATLRIAGACLLVPGLPALARLWIRRATRERRYRSVADVPERDVAVVLGCPPLPDGAPSPMLADRLATGLELYRRGRVRRICVSGNARHRRGDEAASMQGWLLERGVPAQDLLVDGGSLRTRDTLQRARQVYALHGVVLCTQRFHLARSVYLADHAGLDALGVEADRRRYDGPRLEGLRELAAQTAAFVEEQL